jgi:hypothetical protein
LRFLVYQNGELAKDFVLSAAYMFGMDMVPMRQVDSITFKDGVIDCVRKSQDAAGLSLLWSVDGTGRYLLPTTRLPEREEPYILNVELARARLMQVTLKREDWALFEETDKFADQAHEAQNLFIASLQHISDPAKASLLADEALQKAMLFSEKLSLRYAEQYLALRLKGRGLGRHSLGCTIDLAKISDENYRKRLMEMFSFVTVPINWQTIETEQGRYDFSAIDQCMDHLADKHLAISCGPLLCFESGMMPNWMQKSKMEFEKVRERAYEFVHKIVTRYGKYVHFWRVICGMNARNCFGFTYEQMIEMTRTACLAARAADSKSRRIIEILYPWGEYYAFDKQTMPPLVYADVVIQSGISFDAFGLQLEFGWDQPGMHLRDLMQISSRLDCFLPVNKSLHITAAAVPGCSEQGGLGGHWKADWSEATQAEWIEQLYKITLGRPYISSVTYSQFADGGEKTLSGAGLFDEKLNPQKVFMTIGKFQKAIAKTLGEAK